MTAIALPGWAVARRETRLSVGEQYVWFRGRNSGCARILERLDRQAGGDPTRWAVEYRVCGVCGRMMLNLDAELRRRLDVSGVAGRELPCGSECR